MEPRRARCTGGAGRGRAALNERAAKCFAFAAATGGAKEPARQELCFAHAINGEASAKCWLDFPAGNLRLAIGKLTASSTEKRILDVDGISKARNRNPLVPVARGIFRAVKIGTGPAVLCGWGERLR